MAETEKESTIADIIAQGGLLSTSQALAVTLYLVKFIDDLHSKGNVHRQISADTIQLDKENIPKLESVKQEIIIGGICVDQIHFPPQLQNIPPLSLPAEISAAQDVLTQAGILLDPRQIDFYQIGALLCLMVSGHSISDYLRSCKAKADVPEVIRPIVDRALGLNTSNCFCSSAAFAAALEAAAEDDTDSPCLPKSIIIGQPAKVQTEEQLPFKKLGHYEILEHIGHGGMGDVYKAYDKALDRFAAIKVLPPELARQKDFVKRFHTEATAIAKLDHPNIVKIYYSGQDEGYHFFAMQYIDGQSLADLLKNRKKLSTAEALPIIKQALAGIGAAHKSDLIHRDIKPGNILIDRHSRRALVTDFGVVKSAQTSTQITVTGAIMGTADYIAPEQARGAEVDCRTDLYAMGVLMYQMLSGQLPFEAKSATSMMFQHAYETPIALSQIVSEVPEKLAEIVMKLMAKNAGERFKSADDVLDALQNLNLKDVKPTSTLQPDFNEDTDCYGSPELSANLSKLTGKSLFDRLRNWFTDFFGRHAPQLIEYMHTTTQQVDSAIAEYQRQRDNLTELYKEAETSAAELQIQANASRKVAQIAAEHADAAKNTTAKQHALEEAQRSRQAADELAQLAAEQSQQAEDISLRLAKLNAKLAQLNSQQGALNARMNAAKARIKTEQPISSKWYQSKQLINIVIVGILFCFIGLFVYWLWPRPGFAVLENVQGQAAILELKNGVKAYSNRKYVWKNIPDDFPFKIFAQVPGGGKGVVTADVKKSGYIYTIQGGNGYGWQKTKYILNYTDRSFAKVYVYRKFVKKGKLILERNGWAGPVLLLPDNQEVFFVSIDDPGFKGKMSKYETTNAQYCQFLNEALASGDIVVDDNYVKGTSGSNTGTDFVGYNYYRLDGPGWSGPKTTNGGKSRISYNDSAFKVQKGFDDHPVTYVSWYGATAFASYYHWRLPSESEWQAVADYDGSFKYGCGTTINYNIANYIGSKHPHGTTRVGKFGVYGYGLADMAGNVREWTSSVSGNNRIVHGGSCTNYNYICLISKRLAYNPARMYDRQGFRVCLSPVQNKIKITNHAGSLVAWGNNSKGQCNVPTGNDYIAVAAGNQFSIALKKDGTLVAWGDNTKGQCDVPQGDDFIKIDAGSIHAMALRSDGSLVAWGNNDYGQCNVPAGTGYIDISAGGFISLAVNGSGKIEGWGSNWNGLTLSGIPKDNGYVEVSSGWYHSLARKGDGTIVGWGSNGYKQSDTPKDEDYIAVSANGYHSLALRSDGSISGWGRGTGKNNVPVSGNFIDIEAGAWHSLALRDDGSLAAWGSSGDGKCKVPLGNNYIAIAAGENHNIAIFNHPVSSGPIAHWKFDEGSGHVAHDSVGNNNGSLLDFVIDPGANNDSWDDHASFTAKIKGESLNNFKNNALNFDGKESYVAISGSEDFDFGNGNFSISVWCKKDVLDARQKHIINFRRNSATNCIELYDIPGWGLGTYIDNGLNNYRVYADSTCFNDTKWHNIIVTFENSTTDGYKLYLDGKEIGKTTCSGYFSEWDRITIGNYGLPLGDQGGFAGLIGEVQIYDRSLTEGQVQQLYQSQSAMYQQQPSQKASEIVDYVVSFTAKPGLDIRTAKELLDTFDNRHVRGTRTHHFRTEIKDDKLIGHICVDDKASQATLISLLNKNDKLIFIGVKALTEKEFEQHCLLGQPSLHYFSRPI